LFAGGTYFRSIDQGISENDISLEVTVVLDTGMTYDVTLTVSILGTPTEVLAVTQTEPVLPGPCTGGISALRAEVNANSSIIEMYPRGSDFFDPGGADAADNCVTAFADTSMSGGDGPPSNATQPFLDSIFTGNQRTIVMIDTYEDDTGFPSDPPTSIRIQQYDGTDFITYSNLIQGNCPV